MNKIECYAYYSKNLLEIVVLDFDFQTFENDLRCIMKDNKVKYSESEIHVLIRIFFPNIQSPT